MPRPDPTPAWIKTDLRRRSTPPPLPPAPHPATGAAEEALLFGETPRASPQPAQEPAR